MHCTWLYVCIFKMTFQVNFHFSSSGRHSRQRAMHKIHWSGERAFYVCPRKICFEYRCLDFRLAFIFILFFLSLSFICWCDLTYCLQTMVHIFATETLHCVTALLQRTQNMQFYFLSYRILCARFFSPPFFLNVVYICLYVIVLCCLTPRFSAILTSRCCVVFCDIRHQEPTNARDRERFFCCCITVYCILHPSFYHIAVFRLLRFLGRHLSSFLELFVLRLAAFSNRLQLFLGHFNILKTLFYAHLHS